MPDKEAREGIFRIHMKDRPSEENIDFAKLASLTPNYVASDIAYIVNDAATRAFEDNIEISQQLLEEVIRENNPSITEKDIKFYEGVKAELESSGKQETRRPIGFRQ